MIKSQVIILLILCLPSCSALKRSETVRGPASVHGSCEEMAKDLLVSDLKPHYKTSDFKDLDTDFIDQDDLLMSLVDLHQVKANKEEARIALGLLKEKYPSASSKDLARKYTDLLSDCSF